jgi:transcriptional regulator with XRE-family HTH domain
VGWIGRIERGLHMPNIMLLMKIAKVLQMRVKDLIPAEL